MATETASSKSGQSESTDIPLIPARMLNEWAYCPRLAVLEWVHGEWAENADTAKGRQAHRKSDTNKSPALPAPDQIDDKSLTTRRILLGSETLGITGKIDLLDVEDGEVVPVEIKKGKRPHVEHSAYLPERVQVCAQILLLQHAGYSCTRGAIWFAGSREKVDITPDDSLIDATMDAVKGLHGAMSTRDLPPPLIDSPKCTRCSLRPICLPDEINWFANESVAATPPPPQLPSLPLYVQLPGASVGKSGNVLNVKANGETLREVALDEVSELVLAGRVNLTTPAMHELLRRDIPVAWMSSGFWFLGTTGGQGPRSAKTRTAQYAAAEDTTKQLEFVQSLLDAKIRNQRTQLRRGWRGDDADKAAALEKLASAARRVKHENCLDILRGIEGEAAAVYFRSFSNLFTQAVVDLPEFNFARRNRRPPADPVNACLSFCYALLTRTWNNSLSIVGLDPWKGLWHVERPGRPSLALDMMEPYRPIVADSTVLMALNNRELAPGDFVTSAGGCNLTDTGRKALIAAYERRLDKEVTHPLFGYKVSMRRLLHVQARLLCRWLSNDIPQYPHYVPR